MINNSFSPAHKEHLANQPANHDKNWLIIFVVVAIIIIISSIGFNVSNLKVVPTQENTYKAATPGYELTESIQDGLGKPIMIEDTDLGKEYNYKSAFPTYNTIILVSYDNEVLLIKERIPYDKNNTLAPYLKQLGDPQLILNFPQMSDFVKANVFLKNGLVIFTHVKDQSVQEIWRFEPTTQEIFMNSWGKELSTEESGPESF